VVGGGGVVVTGGAVVDGGSVVVVGGMMVVVVVVRGMVVVVGGSVVVVRGMVVVVGGSVVVGRGAVVVGDSVVVGRGMVVVGGGAVVVGGRGVVVTVGKVLGLIELVGTGSGPPPAALTGSPSSTKVDARMPLTSTAVMMLSRFMSGVLGAHGFRGSEPPTTTHEVVVSFRGDRGFSDQCRCLPAARPREARSRSSTPCQDDGRCRLSHGQCRK
jgi:hypothetical protein